MFDYELVECTWAALPKLLGELPLFFARQRFTTFRHRHAATVCNAWAHL
jgi:hypothetical protein